MTDDQLTVIFKALSHPLRRNILTWLQDGDLPEVDLVALSEQGQTVISKHLERLEWAGLISRSPRSGIQNGVRYPKAIRLSHLETDALQHAEKWISQTIEEE